MRSELFWAYKSNEKIFCGKKMVERSLNVKVPRKRLRFGCKDYVRSSWIKRQLSELREYILETRIEKFLRHNSY